jgi:hypothetical protein
MIRASHVIFGAYGFWLPNDPRGSWSTFVVPYNEGLAGPQAAGKPAGEHRLTW